MVAGHLQVKKGYYYAVLNYKDKYDNRHTKWISTGLPEKSNKRKAEAELVKIRSCFEISQEVGDLSSDMLFSDYLEQWLDIVKTRVKITTFSSYSGMVNSTIAPYFRKKNIRLCDLEARHIQTFYSEKCAKVTCQFPKFIEKMECGICGFMTFATRMSSSRQKNIWGFAEK